MFSLNSSPNCTNTISVTSVQSCWAGMKKDQNHSPAIFPCHPYHDKKTNILWERSDGFTKCCALSKEAQNNKIMGFVTHYRRQPRLFQSNSLVNVKKGREALPFLFYSASKKSRTSLYFSVMLLILYQDTRTVFSIKKPYCTVLRHTPSAYSIKLTH